MTPLEELNRREELRKREATENALHIERAKTLGRSVSFIAHDGCEVTVTPEGHVFHNMADWY